MNALTLIKTYVRIEVRGLGLLALLSVLPMLLGAVVAIALQSSFLEPSQIRSLFPAMVWVVFLAAVSGVVERVLEPDMQHRAWEGILLSGVPLYQVYIAKVTFLTAGCLLAYVVSSLTLGVLLAQPLGELSYSWWLIGLLVVFTYACLSTLLSVLSYTSRLKGLLLPVILIPLLFPVIFCAIELSGALWAAKPIADSPWLSILGALASAYALVGAALFERGFQE